MPMLRIRREHKLGLAKARKVAWAWAEQVERRFGMECTVIAGRTSDTVEFTRSGVDGRLIVAPDHFELDARLGLLLGVFAGTIESEIERELDQLLAGRNDIDAAAVDGGTQGAARASTKPAARAAAKTAGAGGAKGAARR